MELEKGGLAGILSEAWYALKIDQSFKNNSIHPTVVTLMEKNTIIWMYPLNQIPFHKKPVSQIIDCRHFPDFAKHIVEQQGQYTLPQPSSGSDFI